MTNIQQLHQPRTFQSVLVTGGAGFIGSHVVRTLLRNHDEVRIVNLDALTYAGNLSNLRDVEGDARHTFVKGDIQDAALLGRLFEEHAFDAVVHLAAESHVDRSIENPLAFLETNILGTAALLNAAKTSWATRGCMDTSLFYHISTDEVYGSLGRRRPVHRNHTVRPTVAVQRIQASSDHVVRAYHHTYGMPVVISNCSNNYGSHQFPETHPLDGLQHRRRTGATCVWEGVNVGIGCGWKTTPRPSTSFCTADGWATPTMLAG